MYIIMIPEIKRKCKSKVLLTEIITLLLFVYITVFTIFGPFVHSVHVRHRNTLTLGFYNSIVLEIRIRSIVMRFVTYQYKFIRFVLFNVLHLSKMSQKFYTFFFVQPEARLCQSAVIHRLYQRRRALAIHQRFFNNIAATVKRCTTVVDKSHLCLATVCSCRHVFWPSSRQLS